MAEFYHIYDYTQVPPATLLVLVEGLDNRSRIQRKNAGLEADLQTVLLAKIHDDIITLSYALGGKQPPNGELITPLFVTKPAAEKGFSTPEDLKAEMNRIRKRHGKR